MGGGWGELGGVECEGVDRGAGARGQVGRGIKRRGGGSEEVGAGPG